MRHPAGVEHSQQVAALGVIDPGDGGVLHAHPQVFAQANFKHNGHKSHKEIAMADQGDMVVGIAVAFDQRRELLGDNPMRLYWPEEL